VSESNFVIFEKKIVLNDCSCKTIEDILKSDIFKYILRKYYENNQVEFTNLSFILSYDYFYNLTCELFLNKNVYKKNEIIKSKTILYTLYNNLYNYYREFLRIALVFDVTNSNTLTNILNTVNHLTITLYRKITERLLNTKYLVYRNLSAGVNTIISLGVGNSFCKETSFIPIIQKIMFEPPLIIDNKQNRRNGEFSFSENTFDISQVDLSNSLCYCINIGKKKAYIYFKSEYIHHILCLSNLFEMIKHDISSKIKPDIVLLLGYDYKLDRCIIHDKNKKVYFAILNGCVENDYFGYVKKILLTAFNLCIIDNKFLPIHGCGAIITLNDNTKKNICLVGDSGVGKSETLETLRADFSNRIRDIEIIFDDMGYIYKKNNHIYFSGTEIGAFIRTDDLDSNYAYKQLDRAIYINPTKNNSRLIMPINLYNRIIDDYKVDCFFYLNNYDDNEEISYYKNINEMKETFVLGKRLALNTTNEVGITNTFFSNPFGPLQKKEQTLLLIDKYFKTLYNNSICGILYTKLGLRDKKKEGLKKAASNLLDALENHLLNK